MSLDGKTIVNQEDSPQISCYESQHHVHQMRQQVDAILIGSNTARIDNPQLTARFPSADTILKQPLRIILSGRNQLPLNLKMFESGRTIIATTETINGYKFLQSNNVEVVVLPKNKYGKVCLMNLLDELGKREIVSVLVEGGRTVHESFFKENLVNKIHVYLSPTIIGTLKRNKL